jgi:hypothetical protein
MVLLAKNHFSESLKDARYKHHQVLPTTSSGEHMFTLDVVGLRSLKINKGE